MYTSRRTVVAGILSTATLPGLSIASTFDVDVVIIGAGSAGLSAATDLIAQGKSVVVVEAANRIGGRAYTDTTTFGVPFDHGCSWVMGPKNMAYVEMAKEWGYTLHNHMNADEAFFVDGREASSEQSDQLGYAWSKFEAALAKVGRSGRDIAASEVVPQDIEFMGNPQTWTGPLDWAVDLTDLSTQDYWNSEDAGSNFLIKEGYGTLVAQMGADIPVKLNNSVSKVDWSGNGVTVETSNGNIRAKCCVITTSPGVLNSGAIEFKPGLPDWKQQAIQNLPMGLLAKITLEFDGERFGLKPNQFLSYAVPGKMPAEAAYFLSFPFDTNLMIGFVGGKFGWDLTSKGQDQAIDFALGELQKIFGSKVRSHFVKGHMTDWGTNPLTLGAYAAAKPGNHSARTELARPVADRLFFAGDTTSVSYPSLCGGAFLTGKRVAKEIEAALK